MRAIRSDSIEAAATVKKQEDKMDQQVKEFLARFERANASSDLTTIASLYADTFMFAGPKGAQAVKKDDFLKVLPKMKAHFAQMGLIETRLHSVETTRLDSKYILAKTNWKISVRNSKGGTNNLNALATYILERNDAANLTIVVQIDHQDLAAAIAAQQGAQPNECSSGR